MPSASTAKLEKQASSEAYDPIQQGIKLVDNKIRNLLKKKGKLDENREKLEKGIALEPEQKLAVLKYDEVCQNLIFAQELRKQFDGIVVEAEKARKRKEKKEAYEREQQDLSKVKEILIIQDVLASMGTDSVREDFLAGRNKAVKLTETELQYLDDLFIEVSPKREPEEGQPPFLEQAQNAAKHLLNIVERKDKEIVGTKYSVLKELIEQISTCGYFDQTTAEENVPQETVAPVAEQPAVIKHVEPEPEPTATETVPSATFQPTGTAPVMEPAVPAVVETAGLYITQRPMADVLTNVMGGGPTTFNFIQESELEPEVAVVPAALPIPTQTFTNANFAPPPGAAAPVYPPPQPEVMYAAPAQYSPVPPPQAQPPLQAAPAPATLPVTTQQFDNSTTFQSSKSQTGAGDWNDSTEQNDWAMQVEQSEQNRWNEPSQQSDDWADNSNDGFQPASRGGGRGGRGRGGGSDRGRGGPRGGRGTYQNGRGNYNQNNRGGGNYYRNNNEGGNNYYQNGYQSRGDGERGDRGERSYRGGGERRGGPRGGQQDRGGNRGAPRGSGGRGGQPRGDRGGRGNRQ